MDHITSLDLAINFYLRKPSSGFVLDSLTNIEFLIIDIRPIGKPLYIPYYIKKNRLINTLSHNKKTGVLYKDNNRFFRCLAWHQEAEIGSLEGHALKLKQELEKHTGLNFDQGVTIHHIHNRS